MISASYLFPSLNADMTTRWRYIHTHRLALNFKVKGRPEYFHINILFDLQLFNVCFLVAFLENKHQSPTRNTDAHTVLVLCSL